MYKIEIFEKFEEISEDLVEFLEKNEKSLIFQSDLWMKFVNNHFKKRKTFFAFVKNKKEEIVLYSLFFKLNLIKNKSYFYCPFGPIFDFKKDKKSFTFFIKELDKLAKKEKICFFRCNPQITYNENLVSLKEKKSDKTFDKLDIFDLLSTFFLKENNFKIAPEQRQAENCYVLDLTKNEEEMLSKMKEKGRYNLKKAIKNGIKIEKTTNINSSEFKAFYNLMIETTRRNNFFPDEKNFYQDIINNLSDKMFLFSAKKDAKVLASAMTSFYGNKAIYHYGASTSNNKDRKLMAPYLLQFEMIKLAKEKNCATYDFLGVVPEIFQKNDKFYVIEGLNKYVFSAKKDAELFINNHKFKGISDFKHKFGGETKSLIGAIDKVYDMKIYFIYHFVKNLRKKLRTILKIKI